MPGIPRAGAGVACAGHLAGGGLQRSEQRGGAVPDVIMAALFRDPRPQRQHRRGPLQRLRLGLGFSSTHSTTALSGGFRYSPVTSRTLVDDPVSSSGSSGGLCQVGGFLVSADPLEEPG